VAQLVKIIYEERESACEQGVGWGGQGWLSGLLAKSVCGDLAFVGEEP